MQHILESMPLPTQMLPPLPPSEMQALQDIRDSDPTVSFFANEDRRRQEEQLAAEQERLIVQQEERDFQAGVAASLGLPASVSVTPLASTSHHSPPLLSTPIPQASSSILTTPNHLRTLPYRPPNITHHMNSDWMHPFEDRSKETPKRRKRDPNQRFRLVFWGEVCCSKYYMCFSANLNTQDDQLPVIRAVNDCPEWPMWSLVDALDIKQELALGADPLQFYDFGHSQWISCTHSYPHELKKDGYLFLRRPSVTCLDFDTHATHAKGKMQHLFLNMPGERSAIKKRLQHRKANPPLVLIDLEDEEESEVEFVGPPVRKRRHSESPIDIISPQPRHRRFQSASSQVSEDLATISPLSSPVSSPISSRLTPMSSPSPIDNNSYGALIYVPESKKKWPDGMYTVDMAKAFLEVDSANFKKLRLKLPERLRRVFGKDIALTTWHDQQRLWANGTERQRDEGVRAGRGAAGLWAAFKARVSRN